MKLSPKDDGSPLMVPFGFQHSFDPLGYSKGKSHFQQAFSWVRNSEKRLALDSLYAFCRLCDDLSDEKSWPEEPRRLSLQKLRAWVLGEWSNNHPFWLSFNKLIDQFQISRESLVDIISGVEMDFMTSQQDWVKIKTWDDLNTYADRVAGAVGICVLNILSSDRSQKTTDYAIPMGRCVQYLNILRDIEEDYAEKRIYVPQEFLEKNLISTQNSWKASDLELVRKELFQRASSFHESANAFSWACLPAEIMVGIYFYGAKKYWKYGKIKKLSRLEKSKAALASLAHFMSSRRPA